MSKKSKKKVTNQYKPPRINGKEVKVMSYLTYNKYINLDNLLAAELP